MFPAIVTTFFFALSAILARRSILLVGSVRANFARQVVALVLLGLWAQTLGQGLRGPELGLLFVSGMIGFGMGDWALFEALPRLGAGLTVLMCQCLAPPIAAVTEWLWLGTTMTGLQVFSSALILVGVVVAMAPVRGEEIPAGHRGVGLIFGMIAALGQGCSAAMSRDAFERSRAAGFALDGISSAYQRLWGGALVIGLLLMVRLWREGRRRAAEIDAPVHWRRAWPWTVTNALVGPALGVSCYQWALKEAPSSLVLPIVAVTPLVAMLLALLLEGTRPSKRALAGGVLAVAGVVALVRAA
jgi:drug/metabolite transporter (DMT)-like permease